MTRSLEGERREGILSSLGTFVGGLVQLLAAGLGLSAVLARSATAYQVVRWASGLYLVYLGARMIHSVDEGDKRTGANAESMPAFRQGIVTEVLHPKTALFFLSFIPPFVDVHAGSVFLQFLLFGMSTNILNTSADVLVALFAGQIANRLLASRRARTNQRRATGAVMVGMGVFVVVREV